LCEARAARERDGRLFSGQFMSGDILVWFLAGIGVGLAVAMLAFLTLSIVDRRSLSRQRRQREARGSDLPAAPSAPQAIRLTSKAAIQTNRTSQRAARDTPRQPERTGGRATAVSHDHEPDFGFLEPEPDTEGAARREPELVFDLTDLPEVATPASVEAYVPSFDPPAPRSQPTQALPQQPSDQQAEPSPRAEAPLETSNEDDSVTEPMVPPPVTKPSREAPQRPEIRRPAPPPKPLPAAAKQKAQAPAASAPAPTKGPAPVSIAPLRSTAARVSGDGSKAPANFRPLLPKADGAARPARPAQRRPFTEITIPFEGPATLGPSPEEATPETRAVSAKPAVAASVAVAPAAPPRPAAPVPEQVTEPVVADAVAVSETPPAPAPAPDEATLDTAAAQSIEQGSGKPASERPSAQRVEKALPKMPPPRLTPDTVEAIFAEAFARGSAEPPDRKS
jgi:hypothetical protein